MGGTLGLNFAIPRWRLSGILWPATSFSGDILALFVVIFLAGLDERKVLRTMKGRNGGCSCALGSRNHNDLLSTSVSKVRIWPSFAVSNAMIEQIIVGLTSPIKGLYDYYL